MENVVFLTTTSFGPSGPSTGQGTSADHSDSENECNPSRSRSNSFNRPRKMMDPGQSFLLGPQFDPDKNYLCRALSDSVGEVWDGSESEMSACSGQNEYGLRKNGSVDCLLTHQKLPMDGTRRRHHSSDSPGALASTIQPLLPPGLGLLVPSTTQQLQDEMCEASIPTTCPDAASKKLSHSLIWGWVKSQQVRIDEHSTLDATALDYTTERSKLSLRDMNSIGPTIW